ncbi:hypothetical protein SSP24_40360 [Streptomyces spinoverrucosus]|uniref:AG1 protein n=1 Tax=Streptomyces spinoverrucosus TaxID=284043 RepID=A0A4Y3VKX1_9ACTN|nr:hypothetical protein [Streptomyces spinoverrucosus]GEC06381.1 hypothetical protein SSP24_40360 [Streptomyces spinoverrucosus]GHB86966.1 hypothetical protein GCM10010397_68250 [Streptomyces spinoverrucosus]
MAWDEWEQLKSEAAERQSAQMQLNQLDPGDGSPGMAGGPSTYGDLEVPNASLTKISKSAHTLYNELWDKARVAVPTSDSAASDLSKQGFALGAGLQHVSNRWEQQLKSLMDACAQITNHLQRTKNIHASDDNYIVRQMSSIATLDAGFDERVGQPGEKNPIYGEKKEKREE